MKSCHNQVIPAHSKRRQHSQSLALIPNVQAFFRQVQASTGMFHKTQMHPEKGPMYLPYDLFEQQIKWLSLYDLDRPKRRVLLASRDKGKSQIVTILGAAWQIYQNPKIKIAVMSFKYEHAAKLVSAIVEILASCACPLRKMHGGYYTHANTQHTPSLIAIGLMSTVRSLHVDYLIMDDPLTVNEQFSKKYIDRSRYFMNEGSCIAARIILIGQLLTRNDLYYDALGDASGSYYLIQSWHGDIPELDKDLAYEIATMGKKDVARNYLGYIDDEEEAIFQSIEFSSAGPQGDLYAFIDPSAKGRDATALAIGWVHDACLIVTGKLFKKHWGDCLCDLVPLVHACRMVFYEENLGIALGYFLQQHGIRAIGCVTNANKIAKISALRGLVKMGRLKLFNDMDSDAVMEVKNWTQTAQHDDMPDAIAMLIAKMGWKVWR